MLAITVYASYRSSLRFGMISFRSTGVVDTIVSMECNKLRGSVDRNESENVDGTDMKGIFSTKNVLQDES